MKHITIIGAYATTLAKQAILVECIESCKKLNTDIMLVTHCTLPEHIVRMVDYHIYDKDNTFNISLSYAWLEVGNTRVILNNHGSHEYPVMKSMRSALSLAQSHGYESFTYNEFDNIFADNDIQKIVSLRQELHSSTKNFMFFTPTGVSWNLDGVDLYDIFYETCFFMGKITPFLSGFNEYFPKTLEDYNTLALNNKGPGILEHHFYAAFQKYISDTLIVNSRTGTYFSDSRLNISTLSGTDCKILPKESNDKYYLYLANYNPKDFLFKVYFNDVEITQIVLNGTITATTFKLLDILSDTKIRVEAYSDNEKIDGYELEYKEIARSEYDKNGKVIISL